MFLPLHDTNPLKVIRFQMVSGTIIILNILVFFYTHYALGTQAGNEANLSWGMVPAVLTGNASLPSDLARIPEVATLFTYMFIHAGWLHVIGNMAFMWVFADNVEDALGHFRFLAFYLFCGVAAALVHTAINPASQAPLVGASGAVAGVIAAYLVLYPKARIWVLLFLKIPVPVPALFALAGWFGFQVISLAGPQSGDVVVAFWAHIGGFLTGLVIALFLKARMLRRLAGGKGIHEES